MYAAESNQSSTPEMLRSIAFHNPELRPIIIKSPACYTELRAWIEQQPGYQAEAAQFAGQQLH